MNISRIRPSYWLLLLLGALALAWLATPSRGHAAEIRDAETVRVAVGEVINDDLYAFGQNVIIDGIVQGDLVAFGGHVIVNGTIEGDLWSAAQAVEINGSVADDVRVAAQSVRVGGSARIGDDLMVGAYSLESEPGATVGGDLRFGAYQALLRGTVDRSVLGNGIAVMLDGEVGGNVSLELGEADPGAAPATFMPPPLITMPAVPDGLTIGEDARVDGTLRYVATTGATIDGEIMGTVTRDLPPLPTGPEVSAAPEPSTMSTLIFAYVRRLVTLLVIGAALLALRPDWVRTLVDREQREPARSLGWGVAGFVAFGVVLVALIVTLFVVTVALSQLTLNTLAAALLGSGALAIAALVAAFLLFVGYMAQIVAGYLGGRWLLERLAPERRLNRYWPLLVGLPIYVLLEAIPWVGVLVALGTIVLAIGALWLWGNDRFLPAPTAPPRPRGDEIAVPGAA